MNMTKKNALGRGLGALIDGVEKEVLEKKVEANLDISVDSIEANPFQPRTSFDEQALEELSLQLKSWVLFNRLQYVRLVQAGTSSLQGKED
jgi:hypothetical protein